MAVASFNPGVQAGRIPATLFVPGGRFLMGLDGGRADERPAHEVDVRPLRVALTPVTNMEYAWFLSAESAAEPPWWKDPDFWGPEQPVVGVSWFEAVAYCNWLSVTLGGRWRLPSEAEWEHAALGFLQPRPLAKPPLRVQRADALRSPWPVGRGAANDYGLSDMGTVVREWCHDWYAPDAYQATRRYDPRGPEQGERKVRRGGSWRQPAGVVPPCSRDSLEPSARSVEGGFRVVREVP